MKNVHEVSRERGKLWEKLQPLNTPRRMSQMSTACQKWEEKARWSEESFALKSLCKDKRQICKSQVSLGITAGSKENKNTL